MGEQSTWTIFKLVQFSTWTYILKKAVISPNRGEFTNKKFRMGLPYAFKRAQYPTNLEIHVEGGSHMTHDSMPMRKLVPSSWFRTYSGSAYMAL